MTRSPHEADEVNKAPGAQATPQHPRDGFNVLRFSVGIPATALSNVFDPDFDPQPILQPLEVCFHSTFTPDPDRPLSLHFDAPHRVHLYPIPPTLHTPKHPCHIVECDPIIIGPAQCDAPLHDKKEKEHTGADDDNRANRDIAANSPGRCQCQRQRQHQRLKQKRLFRRFTIIVVVISITICAPMLLVLLRACWHGITQKGNDYDTDDSPWSETPATASHSVVPLSLLDDLLHLAETWAEIPKTLLSLGHPSNLCFNVSNVPDSILVGQCSKDSLPTEISTLARAVALGIAHDSMTAGTERLGAFDQALAGNIVASASAIASAWEHGLEYQAGVRWIPAVLESLDWARDSLRGIVLDTAADCFFSSPLAFEPSRRHLSATPPGYLVVLDESATLRSVLQTYNNTLLHISGDHCAFFDECRSAKWRYHPLCQLPGLEDDAPNIPALVGFLERWRTTQMDHARHPFAFRTAPSTTGTDEPAIVELTRQVTAVAAEIDRLLELAKERGLWDPAAPPPSEPSPEPQRWFWARYTEWPKGGEVEEHKATALARDAAKRLAALRTSTLLSQELAIVGAAASARSVCRRLATARSVAHRLLRGSSGGWVTVEFEDAPSVAVTRDGRVRVLSSHRALVVHGVLPDPRVQADMVEAVREKVSKAARYVSASVRRLATAEQRMSALTAAAKGGDSALGGRWALVVEDDGD